MSLQLLILSLVLVFKNIVIQKVYFCFSFLFFFIYLLWLVYAINFNFYATLDSSILVGGGKGTAKT